MGDKVLVVKALPLLAPLVGIAGKVATATGARALATGAANVARAGAGALKEGAKKVGAKMVEDKTKTGLSLAALSQQRSQHQDQMRQQQKSDQQNRSMQMAEKAKQGSETMQKQLRGVLDDLRLLKGTLQLPTALSEELRDTIKTLDNDHVIVDNKDETLVHNTTPFTEDIIRRLSETEDEKTEEPLFQPQQLFY
jgi:hypothetical protein